MRNECKWQRGRSLSLKWSAILVLAGSLAACGGGGGGGTSAGTSVPAPAPVTPIDEGDAKLSILSYQPSTTARVARNSEISATFTKALRAATISTANLRLTHSEATVPTLFAYDAAAHKVVIGPQRPLDLLASYTVTAGRGLQDLAGNALDAERSWSFKTADGTWQAPLRLEPENAVAIFPDVAIDSDGNSVAIWSAAAASGWYEVRIASYSANGGWSSVATLSTPGNYNALRPKVRFDGQGNALAVWTQGDGPTATTLPSAWSARYVKGQGWQAPVLLDSPIGGSLEVSLAVGPSGIAFAAWPKPTSPGANSDTDIWAARFVSSSGWEAPTRLASAAGTTQADQPQLAVDAAGDAYALWVQAGGSEPVWFARYRAGTGWQSAVPLGARHMGNAFAPRLAISEAGQVMALWNSVVYVGGPYRFDVWWSVLAAPDGSWSTPALLENDDAGDALWHVLVADSAGNFHAAWSQFAAQYKYGIQHRRYTPGVGWSPIATISTATGTYDQNRAASLVADRNGNLMLVWSVYASGTGGPQEGTFARRYIRDEGWQPPSRISQAAGGSSFATALAVNPDGSIAAAWMEPRPFYSDGPIWVNVLK